MTITITPVNKRPVADAQSVTTPENVAQAITLTGDDSDPLPGETQALTFAITAQPLHGTLTGFNMTTGAVTYTPDHGYFGSDNFNFRVIDDNTAGHPYGLMSDEATVSITVTPVNDPPVLAGIEAAALAYTENDGATPITATITVSDPDSENLTGGTVSIIGGFQSGQDVLTYPPVLNGISGDYDPATGIMTLSGTMPVSVYQDALRLVAYLNTSENPSASARTIAFQVTDGTDDSNVVTRTITVTAVNDPPENHVPGDQTVAEDEWLIFSSAGGNAVWISDVDAGDEPVRVTLTCSPGRVAILPDGPEDSSITLVDTVARINGYLEHLGYIPSHNYNGPAWIEIVTSDQGYSGSGGPQSDTDTIHVTVTPVNDPPTVSVVPNPAQTPEDTPITLVVTIDDGDPEVAQQLTITPLSGPYHGTISIPPVGIMVVDPGSIAIIYTPDHNYNGPDGFSFRVTDDAQAGPPPNLWADATVTISVSPVNDRPVAFSQDLTTAPNTPLPITLNGDDSDPEVEQTLAYAIVDEPQHGTLSDLILGRQLTYTPNPGYTGPDQFTFIVIDDDKAGPVAYLASQPPAPISITVGSPLLAAGAPTADVGVAPLAQMDLQPIVSEAIARWAAAGLSTQGVTALSEAQFVLADLPGVQLGLAAGNTIYLDPNAAGFGWFVDPTPNQDEEFARIGSEGELRAAGAGAIDRMDLLSVVEHELGHLLGLRDLDSIVSSLMGSSLNKGTRRVATPKEVDAVFASMFFD